MSRVLKLIKKTRVSLSINIMKKIISVLMFSLLVFSVAYGQKTPKVIQGNICGNPNIKCKTDSSLFVSFELPFEVPENFIVYESKPFYAIILKSQTVKDMFGGDGDCKAVATEAERIEVQKLFPQNKVFAQNCGYGAVYYTGVKENTVFMAVYGGTTLAQAQKFLSVVQKTGKFENAYIKKMQSQFNGT